jgi:hypothetical protein
MHVNSTIVWRFPIVGSGSSIGISGPTAEEKVTGCKGTGFRLGKVGSVAVNV